MTSSADRPVVEGVDSVTLKCEVDSNPESEVIWRREGDRQVLGSRPVLEIGVVNRKDLGTYSCTATNPLGTATESTDVVTHCMFNCITRQDYSRSFF